MTERTADNTTQVAVEDQIALEEHLKEAVDRGDQTTAELQELRDKEEAARKEIADLKARVALAEAEKLQAQIDALTTYLPPVPQPTYVPYTQPYPCFPNQSYWYGSTILPNTSAYTYTTNTYYPLQHLTTNTSIGGQF